MAYLYDPVSFPPPFFLSLFLINSVTHFPAAQSMGRLIRSIQAWGFLPSLSSTLPNEQYLVHSGGPAPNCCLHSLQSRVSHSPALDISVGGPCLHHHGFPCLHHHGFSSWIIPFRSSRPLLLSVPSLCTTLFLLSLLGPREFQDQPHSISALITSREDGGLTGLGCLLLLLFLPLLGTFPRSCIREVFSPLHSGAPLPKSDYDRLTSAKTRVSCRLCYSKALTATWLEGSTGHVREALTSREVREE